MPALTITKFSGNRLDFFTFQRAFESQIESKLKSNDLRLHYLEQYLEGEPKELIESLPPYRQSERIHRSQDDPNLKYGDPYKIANAYVKKINDWPWVKQGDDQALDRFSTFLTQCRSAMSELTFLSILDHPHNFQTMVRKLPLSLQDRWHLVAGSITPTFANFVTFVFSREAFSRLDVSERTNRFDKGRNANKPRTYGDPSRMTSHVFSHATTVVTTPKNERCLPENTYKMCGRSHVLDDCKELLNKSLQERREFLKENELCFAGYGGGHRLNGFAQRRTCKTYDRRHPTGLHDDNFRPNQSTVKNLNPSDEQSVDVVTASHAETEEAVCSVVGAGNPVAAIPIVPVRRSSLIRC